MESGGDWSKFDISKSLKVLRLGTHAMKLRELRKLHLRWWHARPTSMKQILKAAGLAMDDMIDTIIGSCRECRAWARPKPEIQQSVSLATRFNQTVETEQVWELLFFGEGRRGRGLAAA